MWRSAFGSKPINTAARTYKIPPALVPTTAASLAIETAEVNVFPSRLEKYFEYGVRFRLTETAGKSSATIQDVFVMHPDGGGDHTGPSCWRDILRVPSGGTLDIFYTDDGSKWLGYCAPGSGGTTDKPELQVWVTFTDDNGQWGTVRAVARVMN